jgi:hypothetical protein
MMKTLRLMLTAAAAVLALAPFPSAAEQKPPVDAAPSPAIDEIDCRTLLRLGGEERGYTILYLHGYVSGKRGQTRLLVRDLAADTDRVIEQCIDRPGEKLLAVFERVRAK